MMCRRALSILLFIMKIVSRPALICHLSEYQIQNECCPMCPIGHRVRTDCTSSRSTSCLQCTEGTFMSQPTGLKRCFPCTTCDPGSGLKKHTLCTTTLDASCEPLKGFYCIDSKEEGCMAAQRHKSCQPGQYISEKGTPLRDTVCVDCSDGTYSNGTLTSCLPHTACDSLNLWLIKEATASTDAECGEKTPNIFGIVLGTMTVVFFCIVAFVLVYYFHKKKHAKRRENMQPGRHGDEDNGALSVALATQDG